MTKAAIEVRQLIKTYPGRPPVEAVRGIDLHVPEGMCYGFLGPNGAGKTTTIEILEGLLKPTSGDVEVLGRRWENDAQDIRQRIGVSLQETQLSDRVSVLETLRLFRSFYRNGIAAEEAMKWVSLEEKAKTWIKKLSGGQKQRLAVATALVGNPELLFLDEPTTGLDPTNRRQLWEIIRGFGEQGRTVLLTTHYMEEAEMLCQRVAIVDRGLVIAEGTPRELIASLGASHIVEFELGDGSSSAAVSDSLQPIEGIHDVSFEGGQFRLKVDELHVVLPRILETVGAMNLGLDQLSTRNATLEDVFVQLTGRQLSEKTEEEAA